MLTDPSQNKDQDLWTGLHPRENDPSKSLGRAYENPIPVDHSWASAKQMAPGSFSLHKSRQMANFIVLKK